MFDLKVASIGIRKACALRGVKVAEWRPVHNGNVLLREYDRGWARIYPARGDMFALTKGEVVEAEKYTWREIRDATEAYESDLIVWKGEESET